MNDVIKNLYEVILSRKDNPQEGSYTCYLFDKGLDKILKKIGEESSETIIAAKNKDKNETVNELADLTYHLLVMMVNENIELKDLEEILNERAKKIGNLKQFKNTDKNT